MRLIPSHIEQDAEERSEPDHSHPSGGDFRLAVGQHGMPGGHQRHDYMQQQGDLDAESDDPDSRPRRALDSIENPIPKEEPAVDSLYRFDFAVLRHD
jgi:hypothetical protein